MSWPPKGWTNFFGLVVKPGSAAARWLERNRGRILGRWRPRRASRNAGGFLRPGVPFTLQRKDQGRDIQTGTGEPIIAPGAGHVVRVASDPGGGGAHFGPEYPVVEFTSGRYKGRQVYVGHTVSSLKAGARFRVNDVLSHTQPSGPSNGGAPNGWAEIGYAHGGVPGPFGQETPF